MLALLISLAVFLASRDGIRREGAERVTNAKTTTRKAMTVDEQGLIAPRDRAQTRASTQKAVEPCELLDDARRLALQALVDSWRGDLGDVEKKTYWPYAGLDDDDLQRAALLGDPEASLQLGMNKLWQATRDGGTSFVWSPATESSYPAFLEQVDEELFTKAVLHLQGAVGQELIFASQVLVETFIRYPALHVRFFGEPEEGLTAEEWGLMNIAAIQLLPSYFFPELPPERGLPDLPDRLHQKAEQLAGRYHYTHVFLRDGAGKSTRPAPPPEAIKELAADEQCRRTRGLPPRT